MKRSHLFAGLTVLAVFSMVLPAVGASPDQLIKKALKASKSADKRSKEALKVAKAAKAAAGPQGLQGPAGKDGQNGQDAVPGPQEDWHQVGAVGEPAFEHSWVSANLGTSPVAPAFAKNEDGVVYIRGQIKSGTVNNNCSNSSAFTLPVGYRPVGDTYISALTTDAANTITPGWVAVDAAGKVCVGVGDNRFVSIALSFRV